MGSPDVILDGVIFTGLPESKAISLAGFCNPDPDALFPSEEVVVGFDDCKRCGYPECHMFVTVFDENGDVAEKRYKNHPPEWEQY